MLCEINNWTHVRVRDVLSRAILCFGWRKHYNCGYSSVMECLSLIIEDLERKQTNNSPSHTYTHQTSRQRKHFRKELREMSIIEVM